MMRLVSLVVRGGIAAAAVAMGVGVAAHGHALALTANVVYHDQSGTALSDITGDQATALATQRLGFAVRLPSLWPQGSALRGVWVMDRHVPRFVVLYYGSDTQYISCQLHESLAGTAVVLHWAPATPITVDKTQGLLLQANIGGSYPVSELIWRAHGVRYDLLGSTVTPLNALLGMASSL